MPSARAKAAFLSTRPHTISGRQGSLIEWMSSSSSAASTKGRSARARRSSTESRGPNSVASSQTRL